MWQDAALGSETKDKSEVDAENVLTQSMISKLTQTAVPLDVSAWTNDNQYFDRVIDDHASERTKPDGS